MKPVMMICILMMSPLVSFASLDCEDVVYMSRESTHLSSEVSQLRRGAQSQAHYDQVISTAHKIVMELDETTGLPAANVSDADYTRFKKIQTDIENNPNETQLAQQLEHGDLQYLNNLRVSAMSNIRSLYARCLKN